MRPGDEGQLIRQAQRRDAEALSELYRRHVDQIYRYVRYRIADSVIAEDLTAEVFLRAVEGLADYEDRGAPFSAWLYRIAQARVADYWRAAQHGRPVVIDDLRSEDWPVEDDAVAHDVLEHHRLLAALRQLTEEQQHAIVLRYVQGFSHAEIGLIMDKTEGAVKALQRRALDALSRILTK